MTRGEPPLSAYPEPVQNAWIAFTVELLTEFPGMSLREIGRALGLPARDVDWILAGAARVREAAGGEPCG